MASGVAGLFLALRGLSFMVFKTPMQLHFLRALNSVSYPTLLHAPALDCSHNHDEANPVHDFMPISACTTSCTVRQQLVLGAAGLVCNSQQSVVFDAL